MIRHRVQLRTPVLAYLVRALTLVLAGALVWYGLMVALLAFKVSPHTVNDLSAYRTLYDKAAGVTEGTFTTPVRLIAGFGGLLACLLFLYLASQELPRASVVSRGRDVTFGAGGRGQTVVHPRAVERMAELAARENDDVRAARGRLGIDELDVNIGIERPEGAARALADVRDRVAAALDRHDLPHLPVNVTLTGYHRTD